MKAFSFGKRKPFREKKTTKKNNITKKEKRVEGEKPWFFASKGISPLVAAVILIAITMAIAGLMAAFATNISSSKLTEAKRCTPPTLTLLDLEFAPSSGNITVRMVNSNRNNVMEKVTYSIIYADPTKNKENVALSTVAPKDFVNPLEKMTIIIVTNDTTKPRKLEMTTETCPELTISGEF